MSLVNRMLERVDASGPLWLGGGLSLLLFVFGIQLLGTATEAAAAPLEQLFRSYIASDARALGVSWIATYALANGSVVAALSVSLFEAEIVSTSQLFLMVAGSRLGAAAVVVLIGALDYLQKRRYSMGEAISLGLLTFLLTHSVYLPSTVLGYLLLPWLQDLFGSVGERFEVTFQPLVVLESVTADIVAAIGVVPGFVFAVVVLVASLTLFDRVLKQVDTTWLRERFFRRFRNRWVALGLGLFVTGLTTSVAFSLGVIVPLYNRGYLERREVVPYILGANIGTLFDTVVVAVILESPVGVTLVVALLAIGTLVTLGVLLAFSPYLRLIETVQTRLVEDSRFRLAFLVSLVVVPVAIALLPL
ncbi:solute carrier family 34 (sodium-dependent phosphate cotransporter) [Halogranum amylolyticum]|uniref:Solute carrier family 34 (Sodium-dependent phosphate cotransporter) n=1 Tax=Halogranum amylolyticum TaxID=660520 RepID=A0A1H8TGW5_9EURY|nr:sodium:phosphate symporter [Halogranum amylolyticum]SEO90369.1 solute carrier family 34 (sodium-dependent phosphate cotransporter) [Halogranum amylolyticum]